MCIKARSQSVDEVVGFFDAVLGASHQSQHYLYGAEFGVIHYEDGEMQAVVSTLYTNASSESRAIIW